MRTLSLATAVFIAVCLAPALSACETYSSQFTAGFRNDVNGDLNDLGRIFADAGSSNLACSEAAMYNLITKVQSMLDATATQAGGQQVFTRWLDGYYVALIYGAAFRLGEQGWATTGLDEVLDYNPGHATVAGRFAHFTGTPLSGGCGPNTWNTCMDDHAGSAAAYAWMAAYQSRRLNHNSAWDIESTATRAHGHIEEAFNSVCLRKTQDYYTATPVCNGTITDLYNGTAVTLSVNGTRQLPHYGFGLMTSVFSAVQALEVAGYPYAFQDPDKAIAKGLFDEIRAHADANGNYDSTKPCVQPDAATGKPVANSSCAGPDNYQPNLYQLGKAYDHYFNYAPMTGYKSNTFSSGLFQQASNTPYNAHLSYGRYATYFDMGSWWFDPQSGGVPDFPEDLHDPIGFFEGVSSSGLAQGWACDQDKSDGRVKVDIYTDWSNGWQFVDTVWADSSSESAVNQLCGGGYAHRFWIQLPTWTQGIPLEAWGVDFTWADSAQLTCLQGDCSW